jgi:hypothetical protein
MGYLMNYQRIKYKVIAPLLVLPAVLGVNIVFAQDTVIDTSILDRANNAVTESFEEAAASHQRILQLSDEADELVLKFETEAKAVDALEVYNAGMRRTIERQEREIAQYDVSIAEAAQLQRQIPPLMERMMVALEQFVELDMPFQLDVRRQRLETVRSTFDDSGVNIAGRFSLVLQAYQAENNYGRGMDHYTDTLESGGVERDVDILRVGRIALVYQTSDKTETGMCDKEARQWVALGDEYRRPISTAIRIVDNLATYEIIELPISAPESAQ